MNQTISQLSDEQITMRQHGIGASEMAAVCGISPWDSPLDVYLRKATPTRGPLISTELDSMAIRLGNTLEEPLRLMYEAETGFAVNKPDFTYQHHDYPFILATPDGICKFNDGELNPHGLEIKNVGARMVSAWENGVPDYVELQCRQNMAVLDIDRWDVAALLGGSDFQIFTIERDAELEQTMIEAATFFWENYILTDVSPPEDDPERRRKLFKALFPGGEGKECSEPANPELFGKLCQQYKDLKASIKAAEQKISDIQKELFGEIGNGYGLEFGRYKCTWGKEKGSPSYKAIAEELADGELSEELIEKHRGLPKRVCRVTVKK